MKPSAEPTKAASAPRRVAVVLFNLGGPDGPDAVRPFLFNLFADPAILQVPAPVRYPLAALISTLRAKSARANYALMGGGSPLLPETEAQAHALEAELKRAAPGDQTRVFIAMRYWRPFAHQTAAQVAAFAPDEIVLLPLYPQFSTTTSRSSLKEWAKIYKGPGRTRTVCCWPTADFVIAAHADRIQAAWRAAGAPRPVRLLFSAHGLPQKVIDAGDPYQRQVEATAAAVAERLNRQGDGKDDWAADWSVCYQSRVGPLKWIGPSTPEALEAAAKANLGVVLTPIAFVSEHIETLVELDIEYAELAHELGCPAYVRAPALGTHAGFIEGLAGLVVRALSRGGTAPDGDWRCGAACPTCPASLGVAA